jgi:hypothetical protein
MQISDCKLGKGLGLRRSLAPEKPRQASAVIAIVFQSSNVRRWPLCCYLRSIRKISFHASKSETLFG